MSLLPWLIFLTWHAISSYRFLYWCMHIQAYPSIPTWHCSLLQQLWIHETRIIRIEMDSHICELNEDAAKWMCNSILNWQQRTKNVILFPHIRCSWLTLNRILITLSSAHFHFNFKHRVWIYCTHFKKRIGFDIHFAHVCSVFVNGYQYFTVIIDSQINNSNWSEFTIHLREKMIIFTHTLNVTRTVHKQTTS